VFVSGLLVIATCLIAIIWLVAKFIYFKQMDKFLRDVELMQDDELDSFRQIGDNLYLRRRTHVR
jgi:hypothetical protein